MKFDTKHKEREHIFTLESFHDGYNQEISAQFLPATALSRCMNMKYVKTTTSDGKSVVTVKKRQGTEKISHTPLPAAADIMACTYYVAQSKYILATTSKLYYLDANLDPVEIGSISGLPTFTEFHGKLIIHDSGITKAWNGTTFETLNCLYKNEIIGTGNNVIVDFTGTLAHPAIKPSSLIITYTDGTLKTISDNGAGALTGDVTADTNAINYTNGAFSFRCSGAPDNATSILAQYEKVGGAPQSKAGMVRASQLYMWGDSDNISRLWYSGVNDEDAWDNSSSGGYLDVDKQDGYQLTGALNFFQSLVLLKENSLHRLDNFPGDATFRVEPLISDLGSRAYRTLNNASYDAGVLMSFLSSKGWVALSSSERYGDIQPIVPLSKNFASQAIRYINSSAYSDLNQMDNQLWLMLYNGTAYLDYIFVINLGTGGQLSLYKFAFTSTCYKFVNNEMLIGGADGNLYRLLKGDYRFKDDGVSYSADTYIRGTFTDWKLPFNRKHNKKLIANIYGKAGMIGTLNLFKNGSYTIFDTIQLESPAGDSIIYNDGQEVYIYDMVDGTIGAEHKETIPRKFNYEDIMFEIVDISGASGAEIYGISFVSALLGD